jgi:AraC family transcriptional regulator
LKIVSLPFAGTFEALRREMLGVWARFLERQSEIIGVVNPSIRYDVSRHFDNVYLQCVGVEVREFHSLPPEMLAFELPGGSYVQFIHHGPMSEVQTTYHRAFSELAQAGHLLDPLRPRVERYDPRYIPSRNDRERRDNAYDILLPIV